MNKLLNIESSSNPCFGCGACTQTCPTKAIVLSMNNEGFYCASVDHDKCVGCKKCIEVCLKFGADKGTPMLESGTLFSARSNSVDTVNSCSSGGIAYEMSRYAVLHDWVVVGVTYNYENEIAETVVINTVDSLEKLKGSKYLQSFTQKAFEELVQQVFISETKRFLVFGTPCQIYGFSRLLIQRKIRERFVLVDLFCHGVPSYLVWQSYLQNIKKKLGTNKITNLNFRDKSIGWHNFVMRIESEHNAYSEASEGDLFYHAFFDNVLLSEACFNCEVRCNCSEADMRLGDFWGKRYQDLEDGVSAVLLLTDQGKKFFELVDNVNLLERVEVSECLSAQSVHKYDTIYLRRDALDSLKASSNLRKTIKSYRRKFTIKKRVKIFVKEATVILPDSFRAKIRQWYKKIQ